MICRRKSCRKDGLTTTEGGGVPWPPPTKADRRTPAMSPDRFACQPIPPRVSGGGKCQRGVFDDASKGSPRESLRPIPPAAAQAAAHVKARSLRNYLVAVATPFAAMVASSEVVGQTERRDLVVDYYVAPSLQLPRGCEATSATAAMTISMLLGVVSGPSPFRRARSFILVTDWRATCRRRSSASSAG